MNKHTIIVLNKADLIDRETLDRVRGEIAEQRPQATKMVPSEHGHLPTDVLLGIGAGTEALIAGRWDLLPTLASRSWSAQQARATTRAYDGTSA